MKKLAAILVLAIVTTAMAGPPDPPTEANVSYGPHPRHKMNFWKCQSDQPIGVLLIIHGGGWYSGSKPDKMAKRDYSSGYHVCAIDYPLAAPKGGGQDRLPAMVYSAARAVQFLRSKAKEWNIDPARIVARGVSAGGASSLWLAYHADMADPKSDDPVLRESSRIAGAVGDWAQTTLDPTLITERIGAVVVQQPMVWSTVGATNAEDLGKNWDKYKALSEECTALTHVTKDDPPVYVSYTGGEKNPPNAMTGIHNYMFGVMLKEKCDQAGVPCYLNFKQKVAGHTNPPFSADGFVKKILCPEKAGRE